jgi:hypothetical protein
MEETTPHLLSQCNYSEAVWNLVAANSNLPAFNIMIGKGGPKQWMQHVISSGSKKEKQRKTRVLFTYWWMIWKERNKRIF